MFAPTQTRLDGYTRHKFRVLLCINVRLQAKQVPIHSFDIAGAVITARDPNLLLIGAYDPRHGTSQEEIEGNITVWMDLLRTAIDATALESRPPGTAICADFNWHDPLWGGTRHIELSRLGEATPILDFLQETRMQSVLRPGTITWEQQTRPTQSTIDTVFLNQDLVQGLNWCKIPNADYESDHKTITTSFALSIERQPMQQTRPLYEEANWPAVIKDIHKKLQRPPLEQWPSQQWVIKDRKELNTEAEHFLTAIRKTVVKHTSRARPSPYAKRW